MSLIHTSLKVCLVEGPLTLNPLSHYFVGFFDIYIIRFFKHGWQILSSFVISCCKRNIVYIYKTFVVSAFFLKWARVKYCMFTLFSAMIPLEFFRQLLGVFMFINQFKWSKWKLSLNLYLWSVIDRFCVLWIFPGFSVYAPINNGYKAYPEQSNFWLHSSVFVYKWRGFLLQQKTQSKISCHNNVHCYMYALSL